MKYFEYEQQIQHLKIPFDKWETFVTELFDGTDFLYAWILHDKDVKDGVPVESHVHVMVNLNGKDYKISDVAKWFNDTDEHINVNKKRKKNHWHNMLLYLVHRTENSRHKYQYDPLEVHANFDYIKKLEEIENEIKEYQKTHFVKEEFHKKLQLIEDGIIQEKNARDFFNLYEWYDHQREINLAFKTYQKFNKEDKDMQVMFISGAPGTGKTSMAKVLAKKYDNDYYEVSASNDMFQDYKGEQVIIINELNRNSYDITDFLNILDNYNGQYVGSRYSNKKITNCKLMIITSNNKIGELFNDVNNDHLKALQRRISLYILFDYSQGDFYNFKGYVHGQYECDFDFKHPIPLAINLATIRKMSQTDRENNLVSNLKMALVEEFTK